MDDVRPAWPYHISFELAQFILYNTIKSIDHKWSMVGVDDAKWWLELVARPHDSSSKEKEKRRKIEPYLLSDTNFNAELRFYPDHATLIDLRDDIRQRVEDIENWDKKNKKELKEYERLKRKFGDA